MIKDKDDDSIHSCPSFDQISHPKYEFASPKIDDAYGNFNFTNGGQDMDVLFSAYGLATS